MSRREALGVGVSGLAASMGSPALAWGATGTESALAPTPPMGWNSWNSFATTVTEAQILETAGIMRQRLLPFGYDVLTIDIQWYEPQASGYEYRADAVPCLDAYGRPQPATNRFPSAINGRGFASLGRRIHDMGLRFGIHVMRGIPRLAVDRDLPVLGTSLRASDIADRTSICSWNSDMYGVDMSRPGAQAWYDSLFRLYASWGVDFVKMDDMTRPYDAHAPEIEAAQRAIRGAGRPMVLSLSPGETPLARADHVRRYAQMWRISDDFWDEWSMLEAQFTRLENWAAYAGPGSWPDADMLPLGRLKLGTRDTHLTPDEQVTLMTLWSIARSPLIMGGDLRHLDDRTAALLTNRDVIAVNQASTGNRPHFVEDGARVWSARPSSGVGLYVALFNVTGRERLVGVPLSEFGLVAPTGWRNLWTGETGTLSGDRLERTIPAHGAVLCRLGT